MSYITGFSGFSGSFAAQRETYDYLLKRMGGTLKHRGKDKVVLATHDFFMAENGFLFENTAPEANFFPPFSVCCDAEIYNADELYHLLLSKGFPCRSKAPAELIAGLFVHYGEACASMINGVFAFAVWDEDKKRLFLCRDRLGVKPLFYTFAGGNLLFASEMKALFEFPGVNAVLDEAGLSHLFALLPSRPEGGGVFKDIFELKYGHFAFFDEGGFKERRYWDVGYMENDFSDAEALEHTRYLVTDAVKRQLRSSQNVCTFLSGGIDSSILTAVAATELKARDEGPLYTFSFDYEENVKHFVANDYQVDTDARWAEQVSKLYGTKHHMVECKIDDLAKSLYAAVDARDLPGMADVDSSMLCFCREVAKTHQIALTGECADELFGGYRWFHDEAMLNMETFPWITQLKLRKSLLNPEIADGLDLEGAVRAQYEQTVADIGFGDLEDDETKRRKKMAYINLKWVMTNLVERTERMGMQQGFVGRVPFADYRIVEFLWNLPWPVKYGGAPKRLLRLAFKDMLPEALINRKKSPFPKTYHPKYEAMLKRMMTGLLNDPRSRVHTFLNKDAVLKFMELPVDYGKPWYGQLMAGPQLIAFYIQVEYWLRKYSVMF